MGRNKMKNLLIGAVSTNYTQNDVKRWVESSMWDDCERILLVYNADNTIDVLSSYLKENNVSSVKPTFDYWGNEKSTFEVNTAVCDIQSSYNLIHNTRFLHMFMLLQNETYEKVLITDVRDVYFNSNPFDKIDSDKLTVSSEEIIYENEQWNHAHLHYNLGVIGLSQLSNMPVYNVGVFGGSYELVKQLCADIYLLSVGKHKVADQTSFNYLIQTRYKDNTNFTNLTDKFAVHLQVIVDGKVPFDFTTIPEYTIVHQYDRIKS
jgi:hypothetical protein